MRLPRIGRFEVRVSVVNLEEGERLAAFARRVDAVAKRLADDSGWDDELVAELTDIAGEAGYYCPPG